MGTIYDVTANGVKVPSIAGASGGTDNGLFYYNSTDDNFEGHVAGAKEPIVSNSNLPVQTRFVLAKSAVTYDPSLIYSTTFPTGAAASTWVPYAYNDSDHVVTQDLGSGFFFFGLGTGYVGCVKTGKYRIRFTTTLKTGVANNIMVFPGIRVLSGGGTPGNLAANSFRSSGGYTCGESTLDSTINQWVTLTIQTPVITINANDNITAYLMQIPLSGGAATMSVGEDCLEIERITLD